MRRRELLLGAGAAVCAPQIARAQSPTAQPLLALLPTRQQAALAKLKRSLVTAGVWAKLDALYVFAQLSETAALKNLKTGVAATKVNGPTFIKNKGYLCSKSAKSYLDSGINPSTAGGQFAQNSACYFGWALNFSPMIRNADTGNTTDYIIGQNDGANQDGLSPIFSGGETMSVQPNDGSNLFLNSPAAAGLYSADRSGASATAGYYNGLQMGTSVHASSALFNANVLIGVASDITNSKNFFANPIAAAGFGASLGQAGHTALYNALTTYLTAMGAIASDPYTAYINRLQTLPSGPRQTLYQTLINGLVADGVWQKLDVLWVFAAADATTARTNLVQDRYVVMNTTSGSGDPGSTNFLVDRGFINTGSSLTAVGSFLCDPSDPNLGKGNMTFVQDSAHVMVWSLTDLTNNTEDTTFNGNHTSLTAVVTQNTSNFMAGEVNALANPGSSILAQSDSLGMYTITRTASNFTKYYAHKSAGTLTTASNAGVSTPLTTPGPWTTVQAPRRYAASSIGAGLTDTNELNLFTRLQTYLHAVGAV